jgi:hypothetical protein
MEDMPRIDICETIMQIDFPVEVWEWLDLFGNWRLSDTIMEIPVLIEEMEERHFLEKNLRNA